MYTCTRATATLATTCNFHSTRFGCLFFYGSHSECVCARLMLALSALLTVCNVYLRPVLVACTRCIKYARCTSSFPHWSNSISMLHVSVVASRHRPLMNGVRMRMNSLHFMCDTLNFIATRFIWNFLHSAERFLCSLRSLHVHCIDKQLSRAQMRPYSINVLCAHRSHTGATLASGTPWMVAYRTRSSQLAHNTQ